MTDSSHEAHVPSAHFEAEVEDLVRVLRSYNALTRDRLAEICHAGRWPEHTFNLALASAVNQGRVKRLSDDLYEIAEADSSGGGTPA